MNTVTLDESRRMVWRRGPQVVRRVDAARRGVRAEVRRARGVERAPHGGMAGEAGGARPVRHHGWSQRQLRLGFG